MDPPDTLPLIGDSSHDSPPPPTPSPEEEGDRPAEPGDGGRSAQEFLRFVDELWPAPAGMSSAESAPPRLGHFRLRRVLGSGTFGIVYLADDTVLGRRVALKVPHPAVLLGRGLRERFFREARAAAALDHPNLVPVHEAGQAGPVCYLATTYVEGPTLGDWVRGRGGFVPPREAARLVADLARAMEHAHGRGVLHCDLKPDNILMQAPPEGDGTLPVPRVTDFGLAQLLADGGALSRAGQVAGTPLYMAPEQAQGRRRELGAATDVYALGALLYELLTGRPPFLGADDLEVRQRVLSDEPLLPRRLRPGLPRDLEAVCLKCLEKDPARRYGSAAALADDLSRFLDRRPTRARALGWPTRAWRACRRQPTLAVAGALLAGCVLALAGLGGWYSARLAGKEEEHQEAHREADAAQARAEAEEFGALLQRTRIRADHPEPGWTAVNREDLSRAARLPAAAGRRAELRSALAATLAGVDLLPRAELAPGLTAHALVFHPAGRWLALGAEGGDGTSSEVRVLDAGDGRTLYRLTAPADPAWQQARGKPDGIRSLAVSRDGRWLVAGARSGRLHRWDLSRSPPERASWPGHADSVIDLAFLPDSDALLSLGNDRTARRWAVADGWRQNGEVTGLRLDGSLALMPDGSAVALSPQEGAGMWFGPDLRPLARPGLAGAAINRTVHPGGLFLARAEGRSLFLAETDTARVVGDVRAPGSREAHDENIDSAVFSPDGHLLATASRGDGLVRLWELAGGRLLFDLAPGGTALPAFAPDGRTLAVTAPGKTLLFDVGGLAEASFVAVQRYPIDDFDLSPDGRRLACLAHDPERPGIRLLLWDLGRDPPALMHRATFDLPTATFRRIAVAPGAPGAAFLSGDGVQLWDPPAGAVTGLPEEGLQALRYAPDGRLWLAAGRQVRVWDVARRQRVATWENRPPPELSAVGQVHAVAVGRNWALAGCRDGHLHLLTAAEARLVASWQVASSDVQAVALCPGESLAAAGSTTGEVLLVRPTDGAVLARWRAHADSVGGLAFAGPDLLATGGHDGAVRLWRLGGPKPEELLSVPVPADVRRLAFTPDGRRLLGLLGQERAVRLWDLGRLEERLAEAGLGTGLPPAASLPTAEGSR
jgi:WD40 repeat protein